MSKTSARKPIEYSDYNHDKNDPIEKDTAPKEDNITTEDKNNKDETKNYTPSENTTLKETQNNIITQNLLPLPNTLGDLIATTPYVLPVQIGISQQWQDLLKTADSHAMKVDIVQIEQTNRPYHFYKIKYEFDTETPLRIPTIRNECDSDSIVAYYLPNITPQNRPRCAYLTIECDDPNFGFTVDPNSDDFFVPKVSIDSISKPAQSLITQGIFRTVSTDHKVEKILEMVFYFLRAAIGGIGNTEYFNSLPSDGKYLTSEQTHYGNPSMIGSDQSYPDESSPNDFLSPFRLSTKCEESFYVGRFSTANLINARFTRMTGNLPHNPVGIDHKLDLLGFRAPAESTRDAIDNAFPNPVPYGSISERVITSNDQATKLAELCYFNEDIVWNTIRKNYLTSLQDIRCNQAMLAELLTSMQPSRDAFVEALVDIPFTKYNIVTSRDTLEITDLLLMPFNPMYERCFKLAEMDRRFILHTLSTLISSITKGIESFPFLSVEKATASLTTTVSNQQTPQVTVPLSTLTTFLRGINAKLLGLLCAYEMMSPYMLIDVSEFSYSVERNPILFGITLLSLILKKYLLAKIWLRNPGPWFYEVSQFLRAYFPQYYMPVFNAHGYGSFVTAAGGVQIVRTIAGENKTTIHINDWTLNRVPANVGVTNRQLAATMEFLNLTAFNNIPQDIVLGANTFRINNGRTIQIPFELHGYSASVAPAELPLARQMTQAFNNVILPYYNQIMTSERTPRAAANAYMAVFQKFPVMIHSFAAWAHAILAPILYKECLTPMLWRDDIERNPVDYDRIIVYYDNIRTVNPAWNRATPNEFGVPIIIPGINSNMFGMELTQAFATAILTCVNPNSPYQGMNSVGDKVVLISPFLHLYNNTNVCETLRGYVSQLYARQRFVESIDFIGKFASNNLIDTPSITRIIEVMAGLFTGTTAAVYGLISMIVQGNNYLSASELNGKDTYVNSCMRDNRIFSLNIAYRTRVAQVVNPLAVGDNVRPHVLANFRLLMERVFGERGLMEPKFGMTICRCGLFGTARWNSQHFIPRTSVTIGPTKMQIISAQQNISYFYSVSVSIRGAAERTVTVPDAQSLYNFIAAADPSVTYPAYTIAIRNSIAVTNVMIEFITQALNLNHCVVVVPNKILFNTFYTASSGNADQGDPFTVDEVADLLKSSPNTYTCIKTVNTQFATRSVVTQNIRIKKLPYEPGIPIVPVMNFHLTGQNLTFVDGNFYRESLPRGDLEEKGLMIGARFVVLIEQYPYCLLTPVTVYVRPRTSTLGIAGIKS